LAYEGLVYRFNAAAMQRSNEHVQVGVEVFGRDAASGVDCELVIAAWNAVQEAGVKDAQIAFGDVGLFETFVSALGVSPQSADRLLEHAPTPGDASAQSSALGRAFAALPREEAERAIEEMLGFIKLDDVVGRDPKDILDRLIAKRDGAAGLTEAARDLITRYLAVAGEPTQALDEIAKLAAEAGADLDDSLRRWSAWLGRFHDAGLKVDRQKFDADLGRGFSYYDGPVFEIEAPVFNGGDSPQLMSLGGGGRYDALVGLLSERAVETPAAGAILRPERLAQAAERAAGGTS
jgi:ATP phosphoribosyltransferase regulatory subunit